MSIVVGWAFLLGVVAAGTWWLVRSARRLDIFSVVLVGLLVRFGTMLVAHCVSLLNGDGGFLFVDDQGYAGQAETIANGWTSGSPEPFFEPVGILIHGGPLFYQLVGAVWLVTDGVWAQFGMKLVNVLLASTMILSSWVVARAVIGERGARIAAWFVALMPTLVWWSTPMLKEPLAGALGMGALAAATKLPRPSAVALTTGLVAGVALSRVTVALAVGAGLAAWLTARTFRERRTDFRRLAPVTVLSYCGLVVLLVVVVGGDTGVADRAHDTVNTGREEAKRRIEDGKQVRGPRLEDDSFDSPIGSKLAEAPVTEVAASGVRFLITPRPWAFATQPFDWHQPLYPAMWLWYVLFPAGAIGVWRLRRNPDVLLLLVPTAVTLALYAATLSSGVRQRTAVEPLLLILIVVGISACGWRWAARAGAVVLAFVALGAAVDVSQPLVALPILAAAAGLYWLARRLPEVARQPPPDGPEAARTSQLGCPAL